MFGSEMAFLTILINCIQHDLNAISQRIRTFISIWSYANILLNLNNFFI